jgi:cysteine desulfurase
MIYLDNAATTPVHPDVAQAMIPWLTDHLGNPSSIHVLGREARAAVDAARDTIASHLHVDYGEIYFTSGGTEADNLALLGVMRAAPPARNRIIVSTIEHHAVLHTAKQLQREGYQLSILPVDSEGKVHPDDLRRIVDDRTALVSVMHANNEIGSIQDIRTLADIAHSSGALFHTDAVQSLGYLPLVLRGSTIRSGLDCDLLSISAHKIYGPKGIGALFIRQGVRVSPLLFGGGQEREKRPGTENVTGIIGFGKAIEILRQDREELSARIEQLRFRFIQLLRESIDDIILNGPEREGLPSILNFSIPGIDGSALLMLLDRAGIAASSGSACSSGSIEPSHVLKAIGLPPDLTRSGIRFSLGRYTLEEEIVCAAERIAYIVHTLRS